MARRFSGPALSLLAATIAAATTAVYAVVLYPATLRDPDAPANLAVLAAALGGYLGFAAWALRRPAAGQRLGAVYGIAAGGSWAIEIWAGGPARLDRPVERAVGGTFALLAVVLTVAAGVVAGLRARDRGTALRAGLFAGFVSGAVVFCFAVLMTLATLGSLAARDDYRREFAGSHAPDIATFLVGDILAAATAHLAINLVLGAIGGGLGALLASPGRNGTYGPDRAGPVGPG